MRKELRNQPEPLGPVNDFRNCNPYQDLLIILNGLNRNHAKRFYTYFELTWNWFGSLI